jgi:hypothetical protein
MIIKDARSFMTDVATYIVVIMTVIYTAIYLLPTSFFFDYKYVKPEQETISINTSLFFLSNSRTMKSLQLEYNDILYCKYEWHDDYAFVSSYKSDDITYEKKYTEKKREYRWALPTQPGTCYLRSIVCTDVINIEKCQIFDGLENEIFFKVTSVLSPSNYATWNI